MLRYSPSSVGPHRSIAISSDGSCSASRSEANARLVSSSATGKSTTASSEPKIPATTGAEYRSVTYSARLPNASNARPMATAPGGPSVSGAPAARM